MCVVRDSWDNVKVDLAKELSDILGQAWTIDVNPNQVYAYCKEGYAREQLGSMIAQCVKPSLFTTSTLDVSVLTSSRYVQAAQNQIKSFVDRHGEQGKTEINDVCTAHSLILDVDTSKSFTYNGCAVTSEGQLAILFNEDQLAVNIDDPLEESKLAKALNDAPTASAPMSYIARESVEIGWDKDIDSTKTNISEMLQTEVTLDPKFQETYDTLKAASEAPDHWETNLGNFTRFYFEALASSFRSQSFDSDEMLREAITEAMEKRSVAFRVVDKSKMKKTYNECTFESGVLYMQVSEHC